MVKIYGAHLLMQAVEECTPPVEVGPSAFIPWHIMPHSSDILEDKRLMRAEMRARRQAQASGNLAAFKQLADVFVRNVRLPANSIISSYCAFRDEMDPFPLTEALRAQGHKIALPIVVGKGQPLTFRLYEPGDALVTHAGIQEPLMTAPVIEPDVMLIPLLAFDIMRNRLGYGGGFYDRTIADILSRKPVVTIGIAYACQQVPTVPAGPLDRRLDRIVTEVNVL